MTAATRKLEVGQRYQCETGNVWRITGIDGRMISVTRENGAWDQGLTYTWIPESFDVSGMTLIENEND